MNQKNIIQKDNGVVIENNKGPVNVTINRIINEKVLVALILILIALWVSQRNPTKEREKPPISKPDFFSKSEVIGLEKVGGGVKREGINNKQVFPLPDYSGIAPKSIKKLKGPPSFQKKERGRLVFYRKPVLENGILNLRVSNLKSCLANQNSSIITLSVNDLVSCGVIKNHKLSKKDEVLVNKLLRGNHTDYGEKTGILKVPGFASWEWDKNSAALIWREKDE